MHTSREGMYITYAPFDPLRRGRAIDMTVQERVGLEIYRYWHTSREGMYITYVPFDPLTECVWFVPGEPMGASDGEWDEF